MVEPHVFLLGSKAEAHSASSMHVLLDLTVVNTVSETHSDCIQSQNMWVPVPEIYLFL